MFRHQGKHRTYKHNVRLAAWLSLIAGMVNSIGLLGTATLTTNVTGHFAFFAEEILLRDFDTALAFLMFIGSFLAGAITSGLLVELMLRRKWAMAHAAPMFLEILILLTCSAWGWIAGDAHIGLLACLLLFAMGLQNALATKISGFTVRTTHLTGLFTDLGIELSQWLFYRDPAARRKLSQSMSLRFIIVVCFFAGCLVGGVLFVSIGLQALLITALLLAGALVYERMLIYLYYTRRKITRH